MKKRALILSSLVLASSVGAKSLLGLQYPTGLPISPSGTAHRYGGAGIANNSPYLVSSMNPGNLGGITDASYTFKMQVEYAHISGEIESTDLMDVQLHYLGFAMPLGALGVLGVAYEKDSYASYTYFKPEHLLTVNPTTNDSLFGRTGFEGSVGVTTWEVALGREFTPAFSPGIAYRHRFFDRTHVSTATVKNYSGSLDSTTFTQTAGSFQFGVSGKIEAISYGIYGEYTAKDDLKRETAVSRLVQSPNSKDGYGDREVHIPHSPKTTSTYSLHLPPRGGIGLGWDINPKVKTLADVDVTFWENFWTSDPILDGEYRNTVRVSVGGSFLPARNLLNPKIFQIISYSGGFRFETLPIDGDREFALTAGAGIPLGPTGSLDISLEGGVRKSDDFDYKENFLRLNLSTCGGRRR